MNRTELFSVTEKREETSKSPTHSLTHSLTHSPTHPLTHSPTHPPTHSLTRSLTHSHSHPLTHSLTHPLTHSLTHLTSICSLSRSFSLRYKLSTAVTSKTSKKEQATNITHPWLQTKHINLSMYCIDIMFY